MREIGDYNAKAAEDVTQMMVDTVRYRAAVLPTVGNDAMVVRLWNKRNGVLAEAEYMPTIRKHVTQGGMTFPEAYSPWCVCPQFVIGPALAKGGHSGDGGWTSGHMTFKVHTVPGPLPVYFGSHSRRPSP